MGWGFPSSEEDGQPGVGVDSWNGRTGAVVPIAGDYTISQIGGTTATQVLFGSGGFIGSSANLTFTGTLLSLPFDQGSSQIAMGAGAGGDFRLFFTGTEARVDVIGDLRFNLFGGVGESVIIDLTGPDGGSSSFRVVDFLAARVFEVREDGNAVIGPSAPSTTDRLLIDAVAGNTNALRTQQASATTRWRADNTTAASTVNLAQWSAHGNIDVTGLVEQSRIEHRWVNVAETLNDSEMSFYTRLNDVLTHRVKIANDPSGSAALLVSTTATDTAQAGVYVINATANIGGALDNASTGRWEIRTASGVAAFGSIVPAATGLMSNNVLRVRLNATTFDMTLGSSTAPVVGEYVKVDSGMSWKRKALAVSGVSADEIIIGVTSTAAARTITLQTADITAGRRIFIIKDESGAAGTNNITVDTEGSETIDGVASRDITVDHGVIRLYSNGTNLFSW